MSARGVGLGKLMPHTGPVGCDNRGIEAVACGTALAEFRQARATIDRQEKTNGREV